MSTESFGAGRPRPRRSAASRTLDENLINGSVAPVRVVHNELNRLAELRNNYGLRFRKAASGGVPSGETIH